MQVFLHHIIRNLLPVALAFVVASCEWVKDDLPECPPSDLRVGFKYDYHMFGGDVFSEHVGALYVYLFDRNDRFLSLHTETDPEVLGRRDYEMVFQDLAPDRYRLVTVAFQKSCEEMYKTPGAKFRLPDMQPGDPLGQLEVTLDRKQFGGDASYVVNEHMPLDTLWMNRTENIVETELQTTVRTTVDLMRHTKHLTVTLRQLEDPARITCHDFDIRVTDDNGSMPHDCLIPEGNAEMLTYTPHTVWDSEYIVNTTRATELHRAAHADMNLARLIYHTETAKNASLTIWKRNANRETGTTDEPVVRVDLPDLLVSGRNSAEQTFSPQEYLDREHTYKLDFFLVGDTWSHINVTIGTLSWVVRRQSTDL